MTDHFNYVRAREKSKKKLIYFLFLTIAKPRVGRNNGKLILKTATEEDETESKSEK